MAQQDEEADANRGSRPPPRAAERDAELAQRLRDNLKRRKLQARARTAVADDADSPAPGEAAAEVPRPPPD